MYKLDPVSSLVHEHILRNCVHDVEWVIGPFDHDVEYSHHCKKCGKKGFNHDFYLADYLQDHNLFGTSGLVTLLEQQDVSWSIRTAAKGKYYVALQRGGRGPASCATDRYLALAVCLAALRLFGVIVDDHTREEARSACASSEALRNKARMGRRG